MLSLHIRNWLKLNGEAIYGTRPWTVQAEGNSAKLIAARKWTFANCDASDIRFTRSEDGRTVYVFCLGLPHGDIKVKSLAGKAGYAQKTIANIALLGSDRKVQWIQDPDELVIKAPADMNHLLALAFKISF